MVSLVFKFVTVRSSGLETEVVGRPGRAGRAVTVTRCASGLLVLKLFTSPPPATEQLGQSTTLVASLLRTEAATMRLCVHLSNLASVRPLVES